jgi:general L-amino acid transport system substrate-binding protein
MDGLRRRHLPCRGGGRPARRQQGVEFTGIYCFSPAVRQGDDQFADIVRWTPFTMIEAENGITSRNVDEMLTSSHPAIKSILVTPGLGKALEGDEKWVYDIVRQVGTGTYGESDNRNLGDRSPLQVPRSLNALWTKAGILYAPPIR